VSIRPPRRATQVAPRHRLSRDSASPRPSTAEMPTRRDLSHMSHLSSARKAGDGSRDFGARLDTGPVGHQEKGPVAMFRDTPLQCERVRASGQCLAGTGQDGVHVYWAVLLAEAIGPSGDTQP